MRVGWVGVVVDDDGDPADEAGAEAAGLLCCGGDPMVGFCPSAEGELPAGGLSADGDGMIPAAIFGEEPGCGFSRTAQ